MMITFTVPEENERTVTAMAEYIEREALMRRIKEIHCAECDSYHGVRCRACWVDDTLDYIDSEPSADVEPVQEWISVNDRLPEDGGYVVCIAKRNPFSRFMPMVARIEKNGWVNPITEQYISEVTHWMPIPQPPKGE